MLLDPSRTVGITKLGGTILGTTNKGHFVAKVGEGNVSEVPKEIVEKAKTTLKHLEIGDRSCVHGPVFGPFRLVVVRWWLLRTRR
jgi:6-phosphofructokinase 1